MADTTTENIYKYFLNTLSPCTSPPHTFRNHFILSLECLIQAQKEQVYVMTLQTNQGLTDFKSLLKKKTQEIGRKEA